MKWIHLSVFLSLCAALTAYSETDGVFPSSGRFFGEASPGQPAAGESWALFSDWRSWKEEGRNLLSQAEVERFSAGAGFLLAGEYYVEFRRLRWEEDLEGPYPYDADGTAFKASAPVAASWAVELTAETKHYDKPEAADASALGAGITWQAGDHSVLRGHLSRRPEVYNLYGLLQGIESDTLMLTLERGDSARLLVEAEYIDYNDDNAAFRGLVSVEQAFDVGGQLTPSLKAEFRDAREKSFLLIVPGGGVLGITHPYWAPRNYTSASAGINYELESVSRGKLSASVSLVYDTAEEFGAGASIKWANKYITLAGDLYRSDLWDTSGISIGAHFAF